MELTPLPSLKVAIGQMRVLTGAGQYANNLEQARALLTQAKEASADLLLLPEAFDRGYELNPQVLATIPTDNPTLKALKDWARSTGITLCAGLLENQAGQVFNQLYFVTPQGEITCYSKIHLFASAPTFEQKSFKPGKSRQFVQWKGWRLGLMICYDLRFPELARSYALDGCQALLLSSAWGKGRRPHFDVLMQARSIENQCFLLSSAQAGETPQGLAFAGGSAVLDPMGRFLARADHEELQLLTAILDDQVRLDSLQFMDCLSHRRPHTYAKELSDEISQ